MVPFADYTDVQAIWRPLSDDEIVTVTSWIAEASQQVRDDVPPVGGFDVDERITAGTLNPDTVRSVVARMVRRVMINPDGDSSVTEQTGPFAVTRTKSASTASGDLFITARELARLSGQRSRPQVAFMVNPGVAATF